MKFLIKEIDDVWKKRATNSNWWHDDCPIKINRLREIEVYHKNFSAETLRGKIIVLDDLAENVVKIFKKLFEIQFPINKIQPIDIYSGSDIDSMNDNNSSAFNCRKVMGTEFWSSHALGAAIDINPLQNPYVVIDHDKSEAKIYPKMGTNYLNRRLQEKGMVEGIVEIFQSNGFSVWGGDWKHLQDYHHFQLSWDDIKALTGYERK